MTSQEVAGNEAAPVVLQGEATVAEVPVAPRRPRRNRRLYPKNEAYAEPRRCHACNEVGHLAYACTNFPKWTKADYDKYRAVLGPFICGSEPAASAAKANESSRTSVA